jgi:predicted phosphate transport protein (TIGR00153 family)
VLKQATKKDKKIAALVNEFGTLAAKVIETVECLTNSIKALGDDVEKAATTAECTDKLEEEVDAIEDQLIRKIFNLERSLDTITVLQLKDIAMWTGRVANWAEDAGDIITMIAMKHWA